MKNTKRTIELGTNGSGSTIYVVITTRGEKVLGVERFNTLAEAECWVQWA